MIGSALDFRLSSARRRRRALTLMEVLIALAITTVICGVLGTLMNATAAGTNAQNDGRRSLVRMQAIKSELLDEFTNARAVLATGSNYVVYWVGDQPGVPVAANNAVNYSEMRMLELDTATGTLNLYQAKWPAGSSNGWIVSYDSTCAANTSWYATCTALKSTGNYPAVVIATGVTALTVTLDSTTPSAAKLINVRVDTNDGTVARQLAFSVALANPLAPY